MPRKSEGHADRKSMEQNAEQGGKSRPHFLSSSQAMEEGGRQERGDLHSLSHSYPNFSSRHMMGT